MPASQTASLDRRRNAVITMPLSCTDFIRPLQYVLALAVLLLQAISKVILLHQLRPLETLCKIAPIQLAFCDFVDCALQISQCKGSVPNVSLISYLRTV